MRSQNFVWRKHFLRYYLPLFVWLGVIWMFSAQEGLMVRGEPTLWFLLERKGAHVVEYFILAVLFFRVVGLWTKTLVDRTLWTLAWVVWMATLDETHQFFVPGREGKPSDVGIDMIGATLGVWASIFFGRK